jgi:hypothetical protein
LVPLFKPKSRVPALDPFDVEFDQPSRPTQEWCKWVSPSAIEYVPDCKGGANWEHLDVAKLHHVA